MRRFHFHIESPERGSHFPGKAFTVRYWLLWLLLVAGLAVAIHAYFEYRQAELDRRLELLKKQD